MRRVRPALLAALTALTAAGCTSAVPVAESAPTLGRDAAAAVPGSRVTEHLVVISIDGLRPDAIHKFGAKNIQRLMREGSFTLDARTIAPSKTLPSHTSMLTGVEPSVHRVEWNNDAMDTHGHVTVPTIFGIAHTKGMRTAAFFGKTKFKHLDVPHTLDHSAGPKHTFAGGWPAEDVLRAALPHMRTARPNLTFVHIGEPDYAGHLFGWMTFMYGRAVRTADGAVARIIRDADVTFGRGNYTVIVTADHGGHGRTHGSADPRDVTIPWIVWGKGVEAGSRIADGVRTTDTAATSLWLLGITTPADWTGRAVAQAFTPAAAAIADGAQQQQQQ